MNEEPLSAEQPDLDLEIDLLLEAIYRKYSYDFRHHARASIRRRVQAALTSFGVDRVSLLQDRILRDPTAFTALLRQLTVPVSDMFRDPSYFRALAEHVAPMLATYASLKVWVAGCSTGEEVYSLAILLDEAGLLDRALLYATDINPESLRAAEAGVYALDRVPGFTRNYQQAGGTRSLADYYTAAYGGIRTSTACPGATAVKRARDALTAALTVARSGVPPASHRSSSSSGVTAPVSDMPMDRST